MVDVREITDETCCVAVWGPRALDIVSPLTDQDVTPSGLRLLPLCGGRGRGSARAAHPGVLRRRVRLGDHDVGRRRAATRGGARRGGRARRRDLGRAGGDGLPAHREGLPLLGDRHGPNRLPARGGRRLRGREGPRVRRPRRGSPSGLCCGSCTPSSPTTPTTVLLGSEPLRHSGSERSATSRSAAWSPTVGATVAYALGFRRPAAGRRRHRRVVRPGERALHVAPPSPSTPRTSDWMGVYR